MLLNLIFYFPEVYHKQSQMPELGHGTKLSMVQNCSPLKPFMNNNIYSMLRTSEIDIWDKISPLLPDHYHILHFKHKLHNLSLKLLHDSVILNFYLRLYPSSMFINITTFQTLVLFPSSGEQDMRENLLCQAHW